MEGMDKHFVVCDLMNDLYGFLEAVQCLGMSLYGK